MAWIPPPSGPPVPLPPPPGQGSPGWYPGCPVTVDDAIASGRRLVRPRWGLWDAAITLLGSLGLAVASAIAIAVVWLSSGHSIDEPMSLGGLDLIVGLVIPWIALAGWPLLATALRGNGPRIDLGLRLTWRDAGWGALGGLAALVTGLVASAITMVVTGDFDSAAGGVAEELAASGYVVALAVFALLVAVGAPFVEELAFRGLLYDSMAKRGWATWVTIGASSLAFALFHFELQRLLVLASIGAVLGIVRWRTRSLGASMVAHALNNLPGAIYLLTLR